MGICWIEFVGVGLRQRNDQRKVTYGPAAHPRHTDGRSCKGFQHAAQRPRSHGESSGCSRRLPVSHPPSTGPTHVKGHLLLSKALLNITSALELPPRYFLQVAMYHRGRTRLSGAALRRVHQKATVTGHAVWRIAVVLLRISCPTAWPAPARDGGDLRLLTVGRDRGQIFQPET